MFDLRFCFGADASGAKLGQLPAVPAACVAASAVVGVWATFAEASVGCPPAGEAGVLPYRAAPQRIQNAAPSGLGAPQFGQSMCTTSLHDWMVRQSRSCGPPVCKGQGE
jgi:hypothetical protein